MTLFARRHQLHWAWPNKFTALVFLALAMPVLTAIMVVAVVVFYSVLTTAMLLSMIGWLVYRGVKKLARTTADPGVAE